MKLSFRIVICSSLLTFVVCANFLFGDKAAGTLLAYKEHVRYEAIPFSKRVKLFSYNDTLLRPIKAISCFDYQNSEASINITDGGINYSFVTLRMKSQRSYRLQYNIEIYV